MAGPSEEDQQRALQARRKLRRRAKAVEFEAYEDAELRREEEIHRLAEEARKGPRPPRYNAGAGSLRRGRPSQRGK